MEGAEEAGETIWEGVEHAGRVVAGAAEAAEPALVAGAEDAGELVVAGAVAVTVVALSPEVAAVGGAVVLGTEAAEAAAIGVTEAETFYASLTAEDLGQGGKLAAEQIRALDTLPKTMEELAVSPTENVSGYDAHHIVEQHKFNILKREIEKFGRTRLDDSSNLVHLPTLAQRGGDGFI